MGAYSSPGQGTRNNVASKVSTTMKNVGASAMAIANAKKAENERKRTLQNQVNSSLTDLDAKVYSVPTINDATLDKKLEAKLNEELARIHELSKSGIEGDNSEYLDARSKFESLVTNLGSYIGTFNEQAKIYDGNASNVLNQEGNDSWKMDMFNNFLKDDGKDIDFEFIGDDMVWKYDGNVVNASKNIEAIKAGTDGLLTYNVDHSKSISDLFDFVAPKNYKGKSISNTYKNGGTSSRTDVTDWAEQSTKIRKELQDGKALDDYLDQSSYEKYVPDSQNPGGDGMLIIEGDDTGNEDRKKLLKEKMIDKMMADYGHEKIDPTTGDYVYETEDAKSVSVDANYEEGEDQKTMQIEADYIRNLEYGSKEDFKEIAEYLTRNNKDPNIKYRAGKHDVNGVESGGVIVQQYVEGKWVERPTLINQRNTSKDNNMQLKKLLKITTDEGKQTAVLDP